MLWHRERVVTSIAENSDQVVALARGMREPAGRSRRIRAGAHAHPASEAHPVLATILWSLALTAVFAPFALRAYARRTGG